MEIINEIVYLTYKEKLISFIVWIKYITQSIMLYVPYRSLSEVDYVFTMTNTNECR